MSLSALSRLQVDDRVIVVGAGGHARSVIGVLRDIGCSIKGLIADGDHSDKAFSGIDWLGTLDTARDLHNRMLDSVWVMAIGDNYHRLRIMRDIQAACQAAHFPVVAHPSAIVAADVRIEEAVVIMPGAIVMAGGHLSACSLVNTRASLDHECSLAEGAALAPGAIAGGRVSIGRRSFIGIGATLAQGIRIGDDVVLGAGSLVLQDVPDRVVAYGSPARVIRSRSEAEPYF